MNGTVRLIIIILLVLLVLGMLPAWPYSRGWGLGYYPSGGLGLLLIVVILILVLGDKKRR